MAKVDGGFSESRLRNPGRPLTASVAELEADFLIFLGRHRFQQIELHDHHPQRQMDAPKQRDDAIGIFLFEM